MDVGLIAAGLVLQALVLVAAGVWAIGGLKSELIREIHANRTYIDLELAKVRQEMSAAQIDVAKNYIAKASFSAYMDRFQNSIFGKFGEVLNAVDKVDARHIRLEEKVMAAVERRGR